MAKVQLTTSVFFTVKRQSTTIVTGSMKESVSDEFHDEAVSQNLEVAAAAVDQAISLGGLTTVKALLLISDQNVSFKFNGGTTVIVGKSVYLRDCAVTAILVSNAGTLEANIEMMAVGV